MKKALRLYLGILFSLTIFILASCNGDGGSSGTPSILSVSMSIPTNNATNTSTTPIIQLSFNLPMNVQTINSTTIQLVGPNNTVIPVGAFLPGSANTLFTFAPSTPLSPNTQYSVVVTTNVASSVAAIQPGSVTTFNFTTGNSATPMAQLTNPISSSGVSLAPAVEILFSKLMSVPTLNATNVQLIGPNGNVLLGTIIPGTVSGTLSTMTFSPASPLAANTNYTIQLSSGIQDTNGISIAPTSFTLKTGSSLTPNLQLVHPTDNAENVSRVTGIQVVFSESMNASTVNTSNVQILDPNNTSVPIGSITTGGANTFVFSPASPLASNTKYIIKFGTGIQDTFGTSLPQTLRYAFTGTSITPVGLMLNPVNNATGVSRTSSLSLWFSENMNATTINSSTVQLAAVIAPSISIPITVSGSGNSYTVTPIGTLLPNTQYMLTFTTSIQDTSGNAMSALSQAQYFTTGN